ncbi:MAG TPA: methylglyoxal synthase [Caldilineaceae bacterium]|nr:methylglyoxal synthase [Caldilineaceae bacterium]
MSITMSNEPTKRENFQRIALIAHDNKKHDLLEWARYNRPRLVEHEIFATGTTGKLLEQELDIAVNKLQSGPLGGDQQIGARIAEGLIDFLLFFWDPLEPQPHDPDVRALLRIAVVWNIPIACNRASADLMISSPLLSAGYERRSPDYATHLHRPLFLNAGHDQLGQPGAPLLMTVS